MEPNASVVILSCNKLSYTRICLESLLETQARSWEIVVVDNGSGDGSVQWLREFSRKAEGRSVPFTLIENSSNIGCSAARNQGIEAGKGRMIAFIDNDTATRSRSWLTRLGQELKQDRGVGMVGPKLVYPYPPYDIQCAGAAVSPSGRVKFLGRGEARKDPGFNLKKEVQCLISACCMIRRDVAVKCGGFDPAFNPVQYEDIDYCYRIRENGYRILYVPEVELYHFESVTTAGTAGLPNKRNVIENGLKFKERWQHRFSTENGPPDEDTKWKDIPARPLDAIGPLELTP